MGKTLVAGRLFHLHRQDVLVIQQAVQSLENEQARHYLTTLLIGIRQQQEESKESAVSDVYEEILGIQERMELWKPDASCTHVHIVCGDSLGGSMKAALINENLSASHKLIVLTENYAVGPIYHLDEEEGRSARSKWFRDNIAGCVHYGEQLEEHYTDLLAAMALIPEQAHIIVWADDNVCEQIGMRHALYLLRSRSNPVSVYDACAICEELYNTEDRIQHYHHSGEIPVNKLQQALQSIDADYSLDARQRQQLSNEWQQLTQQSGALRIWDTDHVQEVSVDYHDAYLLEKLDRLQSLTARKEGFLIAPRLIAEAMAYSEQFTGDAFWEYRLRELIYQGILEIKGVPCSMRHYSIRRKRT